MDWFLFYFVVILILFNIAKNYTMEFFESWTFNTFVFSVLCSIIASFIFILLLLRCFRPKIKVVCLISQGDSRFDNEKKVVYGFKIINRGIFSVYDINAELSSFTLFQGENNITDRKFSELSLIKSHVTNLPGYYSRKDKGENCLQFFSEDDIASEMKSGKHIRFQTTGRHSLTGLAKVSSHNFNRFSCIKNGSFVSGDCEEIS